MGAAYVQGVLRYYCYYDYYGETAIALASLPGSLLLLLLLLLWGECHEGLPICRGVCLLLLLPLLWGDCHGVAKLQGDIALHSLLFHTVRRKCSLLDSLFYKAVLLLCGISLCMTYSYC